MHKKNCEYIAKALDCTLNPKADKIIERININAGFCPCVPPSKMEKGKNYLCPCSDLEKHLKKQGHCHCNLFIAKKKRPFWKFWEK